MEMSTSEESWKLLRDAVDTFDCRECEICGNKHYEIDRTICPECRERLKRLLYDED